MKVIIRVFLIGCIAFSWGVFYSGICLYDGFYHIRQRQMAIAVADFICASRLNPFDPQGAYFAASTIALSGDMSGAVEYYDKVRRIAPDFLLNNELRNEALYREEHK